MRRPFSHLGRCLTSTARRRGASVAGLTNASKPVAVLARASIRPSLHHLQPQYRAAFASTAAAVSEAADASTSSSSSSTPPPLFEDPRVAILEAALACVPEHGWTEDALAAGAASLGFPAVAHGMFGRGAVELVEHFADRVDRQWLAELGARKGELAALPSARERVALAVQIRLRLLAPQLAQWPQALSLGLLPQNLEGTAKRIALLADELCFVASQGGGGSVEAGAEGGEMDGGEDALDWYAQRATMGSVYVATELFFLTDYSEDHSDTWTFLDRRLHDLDGLRTAPRSVQEGVLALHTAAGALASAAASLAQPAVWAAVQRLPVNGALVGALQTVLANVAAMAPPAVDPFRTPPAASSASAGEEAEAADFPAPAERDPYEGKGGTKGAAPGAGKDGSAPDDKEKQ